ncbi:MAG: hypothetical protein HC850_18370 [Rhodomicrobium sp.]|nr:hypothetical protein [Rhodomicrobium sp.]
MPAAMELGPTEAPSEVSQTSAAAVLAEAQLQTTQSTPGADTGVGPPAADPGGDAPGAADPIITPITDIVGDVVQVLDPVVEQVVAPLVGTVGDGGSGARSGRAGDHARGRAGADARHEYSGDLLELGSGNGAPIITASVAASSSSIDFEVGPAGGSLPLDELFSAGSYSDYNLALQANVSVSANPAPAETLLSDLDIATELSALTGSAPSESGQGNSQHFALPSLLGDIGLHGLGL